MLSNSVSRLSSSNLEEWLDWLVRPPSAYPVSCLKVVWSLADFTKAVLSNLPGNVLADLSSPPHKARWWDYKFFYIADKVLSIGKNGTEVSFYDLSQYFPDESEPDSLELLQQKADMLRDVLFDLGVIRPSSLSSPVAAFNGHKILSLVKATVPTIFDASDNVIDAYATALQCTPREWVSNYQVGHFSNLWGYDLSSAYPAEAAKLLHLGDCAFLRATELNLSAYYGFLVGDFTVYPDHPMAYCSPFLADRGDGIPINFTGTEHDYPCLLDEVRTLYRYNMGEFKMKRGWFVSPTSGVRPRRPFKELVEVLYILRGGGSPENSKLRSYLLKRVLNGLIGKLLESRRDEKGNVIEYGDLYNPIYHSLCTTGTRLRVFDFIVQNNITREQLVHVGVDGLKATCDLGLPEEASLGNWRQTNEAPAVVLSPGAIISLSRNFKSTGYIDFFAETILHAGASIFGVSRKNPIDLRTLFLNQNRYFSRLPRTAGELMSGESYFSDPICV